MNEITYYYLSCCIINIQNVDSEIFITLIMMKSVNVLTDEENKEIEERKRFNIPNIFIQ
jgi:hypothetical protein